MTWSPIEGVDRKTPNGTPDSKSYMLNWFIARVHGVHGPGWLCTTCKKKKKKKKKKTGMSRKSRNQHMFFHFTQLSNWILNMILRPQTSLETHTRTHPHTHPHTCCFNGSTPTSHVVWIHISLKFQWSIKQLVICIRYQNGSYETDGKWRLGKYCWTPNTLEENWLKRVSFDCNCGIHL